MDRTLGMVESRFADIIWENAPLSSGKLCALAAEHLDWKKSTTFTVLKRLCEKGIFVNEGGTVRTRISRESFYAEQSERFVSDNFGGSLPAFLAAFSSRSTLSADEVAALKKLIVDYEEA